MRLVYKFNNYENNDRLFELCRYSKDLYNQALYYVNQMLKDNKYVSYYDLNKYMYNLVNLDGEINYKKLKAQVSQQCLKVLDKNVKGYFKSIKEYKNHPEKFKGCPKLPQYKRKNGYHQLIYTNQSACIKNSKIYFSKDLYIKIPQYKEYKDRIDHFNEIRVNPKNGFTEIEIIYTVDDYRCDVDYNKFASIDLGLSNLVTLVTEDQHPVIYSGKQIKSKNQYFNKTISKYKSILEKENGCKKSKRINQLWNKRYNQLDDVYHKVSRHIVNYLIQNNIGNLIIGYNNGWKDSIKLGKVTNQNFVNVSYDRLISMLTYKCECVGIIVITNEESYTSKCDSLSLESIEFHENYNGKRVKRGLYLSYTGKVINADINGAINIMRKVVGDSYVKDKIINSGLLFNPIKFKNLYNLDY